MARQEHDREDLLRVATALVDRIELKVAGGEPVVIGFRSSGCGSVFFGGEPVYQFNRRGELRRAYFEGRLYKAERRHLVSLNRQRTPQGVHLLRHDLTANETVVFLRTMCRTLDELAAAISQQRHQVLRQVPLDAELVPRVSAWLSEVTAQPTIAESPHAR